MSEQQGVQQLLGQLSRHLSHRTFNKLQAAVAPTLLDDDCNVVISAPTGAGKTLMMELAIIRALRPRLELGAASSCCGAVVYICPVKALASEKHGTWQKQFSGLRVVIETGDQGGSGNESFTNISTADIIVTTPERWDSITRRWREGTALSLVSGVGLLLVDEVHMVAESRGAALEAVVSRMKTIQEVSRAIHRRNQQNAGRTIDPTVGSPAVKLRFVAVSSTIPNIDDLATWLDAPPHGVFHFTESDRPIPLRTEVLSFSTTGGSAFAFDKFLNYKLPQVIVQYSDAKPTLVFCASRKDAATTALHLAAEFNPAAAGPPHAIASGSPQLANSAALAEDAQLQKCLRSGVAFHHAALSLSDRRLVEELYLQQLVLIICTTTTLAVGVNLPARLVVVKGTSFYRNGGQRDDLPLSEVIQMTGRAGRAGFDTEGVAVIMTQATKAFKYQAIQYGGNAAATVVESTLHEHMIEHLNAEIALRTVTTTATAREWLQTTFLWIRMRRNPLHYGLQAGIDPGSFLTSLVEQMLCNLAAESCITRIAPAASGGADESHDLEPTPIGRALARLYIDFATVKMFNQHFEQMRTSSSASGQQEQQQEEVASGAQREKKHVQTTLDGTEVRSAFGDIADVLRVFCRASEFADCRIRQGDKSFLNEANKKIRHPLRSDGKKVGSREVRETWQKVYVLFELHFRHSAICEWSLKSDLLRALSSAARVSRFLIEFGLHVANFSLINAAWDLHRNIERQCWGDGGGTVRQLKGVGDAIARALESAGISSLPDIATSDPRRIEALCAKHPPFGQELIQQAQRVTRFDVSVSAQGDSEVQLVLQPLNELDGAAPNGGTFTTCFFTLLVGRPYTSGVLVHRRFRHSQAGERHTFTVPLLNGHRRVEEMKLLHVVVINEFFVGVDCRKALKVGISQQEAPVAVPEPPVRPKFTAESKLGGEACHKPEALSTTSVRVPNEHQTSGVPGLQPQRCRRRFLRLPSDDDDDGCADRPRDDKLAMRLLAGTAPPPPLLMPPSRPAQAQNHRSPEGEPNASVAHSVLGGNHEVHAQFLAAKAELLAKFDAVHSRGEHPPTPSPALELLCDKDVGAESRKRLREELQDSHKSFTPPPPPGELGAAHLVGAGSDDDGDADAVSTLREDFLSERQQRKVAEFITLPPHRRCNVKLPDSPLPHAAATKSTAMPLAPPVCRAQRIPAPQTPCLSHFAPAVGRGTRLRTARKDRSGELGFASIREMVQSALSATHRHPAPPSPTQQHHYAPHHPVTHMQPVPLQAAHGYAPIPWDAQRHSVWPPPCPQQQQQQQQHYFFQQQYEHLQAPFGVSMMSGQPHASVYPQQNAYWSNNAMPYAWPHQQPSAQPQHQNSTHFHYQ